VRLRASEAARAYYFIAMDLTTFSPRCFWPFRTALRTAETLIFVVGQSFESFENGSWAMNEPTIPWRKGALRISIELRGSAPSTNGTRR